MPDAEVGILALQGDYALHQDVFRRLGAKPVLVRQPGELSEISRLVIPGGEATTIQVLINRFGFRQPLINFGRDKPVWGTCAGLILLACKVKGGLIEPLGLIDITVERNAYGSQVNSFVAEGTVSFQGTSKPLEMVFIRAPRIIEFSSRVAPLGKLGNEITMARQDNILVSAFHPELTDNASVHEYFLDM